MLRDARCSKEPRNNRILSRTSFGDKEFRIPGNIWRNAKISVELSSYTSDKLGTTLLSATDERSKCSNCNSSNDTSVLFTFAKLFCKTSKFLVKRNNGACTMEWHVASRILFEEANLRNVVSPVRRYRGS